MGMVQVRHPTDPNRPMMIEMEHYDPDKHELWADHSVPTLVRPDYDPPSAPVRDDIAIVMGGASCLWDDIAEFRAFGLEPDECVVIAVNDAGIYWPGRVDHWATYHPEELPAREAMRAARGYGGGYIRWTHTFPHGLKKRELYCDRLLDGWGGSSGLFGIGVAFELNIPRIACCGIPMDSGGWFNRDGTWGVFERYRRKWPARLDKMRGRVKSFSGWTADMLGVPTEEWFDG